MVSFISDFEQFPGSCKPAARRAHKPSLHFGLRKDAHLSPHGDIADIDRLKFCRTAADQRQDRRNLRQPGEQVKEIIFGPKHNARPQ